MSNFIVVEGISKVLGRCYMTEFTNCLVWISDNGKRRIFGPRVTRRMSEEEVTEIADEFEKRLNKIGIVRSGRIVTSRKN
jgi:hypothetical protein